MATSAFKSTTKRSSIGTPTTADDSGSSNRAHRRSRSLSRFSRLPPESSEDFGYVPAPRGKFVNTVRGSGFPEISLDDLAIEFFPVKEPVDDRESERGRPSRRLSVASPSATVMTPAQRRGRSASRQRLGVGDGKSNACNGNGGGRAVSDANSRRRRSVSVARCQISDSESDIDHSQSSSNRLNTKCFSGAKGEISSLQKPTASSHRRLGRSLSQKDLSKSHDGYSSHSSALTDDEARDGRSSKNVIEKTIRAVYAQNKAQPQIGDGGNSGLYEAMRKELRYAVDEIKMELEHAMVTKTSALASDDCLQLDNSNGVQAVSVIRKNYASKLEESEKRKQDLLAEILLEEQRGRELSKIVRKLLPDTKSSDVTENPSLPRERNNDRNRMSKHLTEEAEKYIEDFLSNVEDTDISSFDGERSDAGSSLGGIAKPRDATTRCVQTQTFQSPTPSNSIPVEMDGVILPWLQWETSNDSSLHPRNNKRDIPVTPKTISWDVAQEMNSTQDPRNNSTSSRGSWSPGLGDDRSKNTGENTYSKFKECGSYQRSQFDMDGYLKLKNEEDLLFERWREQNRISSGGLLICSNAHF